MLAFLFYHLSTPITTQQWSFSGHCHSLNNISNGENYPQSTIKIDHHHNVNKNRAWNIVNKVWKCVKPMHRHTHTHIHTSFTNNLSTEIVVCPALYLQTENTKRNTHKMKSQRKLKQITMDRHRSLPCTLCWKFKYRFDSSESGTDQPYDNDEDDTQRNIVYMCIHTHFHIHTALESRPLARLTFLLLLHTVPWTVLYSNIETHERMARAYI